MRSTGPVDAPAQSRPAPSRRSWSPIRSARAVAAVAVTLSLAVLLPGGVSAAGPTPEHAVTTATPVASATPVSTAATAETTPPTAAPTYGPTSAPTLARPDVPLVIVENGVHQPGLVRRVNATASTEGLQLTQTTIANYWYWAGGVGVSGSLSPYAHAVLQDVSPSGRVLTFAPVYADETGSFSALVKYDELFGEVGTHTLRITDDYGRVQTAALEVTQYPGKTLTVSVDPPTTTRFDFYDDPTTVTVTGLAPGELAHVVLFSPTGIAYEFGPLGFLRADDSGTVRAVFDASGGTIQTGTWEASVLTQDQTKNGYATFTVTAGGPGPQANRVLQLAAPSITSTRFADPGMTFVARRFEPFEIVQMTLTTTRGEQIFLGRYRVNGTGALTNGAQGNYAPLGQYRITVTSVRSGDYATGTFTVTDDSGYSPAPPVITTSDRISRLAMMDPARGLRVTGTGFPPGATVYLTVTSADSVRMRMSDRSITAAPANARGRIAFRVNPIDVPTPGRYDVVLQSYLGGPLLLRSSVTVTR